MRLSSFSVRLAALLAVVVGVMLAFGSLSPAPSRDALAANDNPEGVICGGLSNLEVDGNPVPGFTGIVLGRIDYAAPDVSISASAYTSPPDPGPMPDCQTFGAALPAGTKYALQTTPRPAASGTYNPGNKTMSLDTCQFGGGFGGLTVTGWSRITATITIDTTPGNKANGSFQLQSPVGSGTCDVLDGESGAECANAVDDDNNGLVNDGCPAVGGAETANWCGKNTVDNDSDGSVNDGCPLTPTSTISIDTTIEYFDSTEQDGSPAAFNSDWDADGCIDWDELDPTPATRDGFDPLNPLDCNPTDVSGVYNILATVTPVSKSGGNIVPGTYFHCIGSLDQSGAGPVFAVDGNLVCYTDSPGLSGAGGSAVPTRDDGLSGAPPPPPYTAGEPTPVSGTFDSTTDTLAITACFRDIGGVLKPNVIVNATIDTTSLTGTVDIHGNQAVADCNALVAVQHPGVVVKLLNVPVQLAKQVPAFDHDVDGCSDADELASPAVGKCGDDPYSPLDSDSSLNSIANVLVTQTAADINNVTGALIPGVYFHCIADIQQDGSKNLTSRLECYTDNPALVVNPPGTGTVQNDNDGAPDNNDICGAMPLQPAAQCGDGFPGTPPPLQFADIDATHVQFSGAGNNIDNGTNLIHIEGCLSGVDNEALGGANHNVYARATIALHNGAMVSNGGPTAATAMNAGHGLVDIWLAETTCAVPVGAPDIDDAAIEIAEQATKTGVAAQNQWDTDLDGCSDKQELRNTRGTGGLRDPYNRWDFMDVPTGTALARDRSVSGADISAVVGRFGSNDATAGKYTRTSDPLSVPNPPIAPSGNRQNYHPAYDRGGSLVGSNPWNLKPPNGAIDGGDISGAVGQFGNNCVA